MDTIRVAARTLRKQWGFSTVVILSLALAISLNTTMYSVLDALIHPRVDVRDPDQLYRVQFYGDYKQVVPQEKRDSAMRSGVPGIEAEAWYDQVSTYGKSLMQAGRNFAEAAVGRASPEFFTLVGPRLVAGRFFTHADHDAGARPIVLNERVLGELFPHGENPLGATVTIGDSSFTVVGVMSRYADLPGEQMGGWTYGESRRREMFARMVRLRPGVTREQAERDLDNVAQRIAAAGGFGPKDVAFRFHKAAEPQFHAQRFHIAFIVAVLAVLLVACVNLANMQLARGIARRRELALRSALGASRRRIVTLLLTESVVLAAAGLIVGLVLTYWSAVALRAAIPPAIGSYIVEPQLSWRVLAFAVAATMACVVLIGLAPAVQVSRVDPGEMLKSGAGTGATRRHRRQYGYLVAAELALALGLLSGASVIVRSAFRASEDWFGFDPGPVVTGFDYASVTPGASTPESALLYATEQRLEHIPGVELASAALMHGVENNAVVVSDSGRGLREIPAPNYSFKSVTPTYLRSMGLPVIRGRDFRDGERDEPAVIIDELTAMRIWPNGNPVGALIKLGDMKSRAPFVRIVGVSGHRRRDLNHFVELATVNGVYLGEVLYLPGRNDVIEAKTRHGPMASIVVRAKEDGAPLPIALRRIGVIAPKSLGENFRLARMNRDFVAALFVLFAAIGVGLAAIGVYGVIAHSVAERRRELGVRIALGATSRDILDAVLRDSLVIALAGVAVGLFLTKYAVPLLGAFIFEDDLYNAPLFAGAAVFLIAIAGAAALVPATRATRVDPTESLRCE